MKRKIKEKKGNVVLAFIICFGVFSLIKNTLDANNARSEMYAICVIPFLIFLFINFKDVINKFNN